MKLRSFLLASSALFLMLSCQPKGAQTKSKQGKSARFAYDAQKGICINAKGEKGLNKANPEEIRLTKNCECTDLVGIDLVDLLPGITQMNRFSYNVLKGFNFRGADLSQAQIHFNHLENCDLSGANLKGFSFGYTYIDGSVDAFTQLPENGCLKVENGKISCRQ